MREAYRRNKQMLYEELKSNNEQLLVCLTYTSPEILSFDQITDKIIVLLHRLMKESEKVTR